MTEKGPSRSGTKRGRGSLFDQKHAKAGQGDQEVDDGNPREPKRTKQRKTRSKAPARVEEPEEDGDSVEVAVEEVAVEDEGEEQESKVERKVESDDRERESKDEVAPEGIVLRAIRV